MQTEEQRASVSNGKLRLKKSQIRSLTFAEMGAGNEMGVVGMMTGTLACISQGCPAPDTYKQCPSCSQYCSGYCP
jgi:hypothetical protein